MKGIEASRIYFSPKEIQKSGIRQMSAVFLEGLFWRAALTVWQSFLDELGLVNDLQRFNT